MTNAKIVELELELSPAEHLELLEVLSEAGKTKLAVKVNLAWLESKQIVVEPPSEGSHHSPIVVESSLLHSKEIVAVRYNSEEEDAR